jgi:hypothetical protein
MSAFTRKTPIRTASPLLAGLLLAAGGAIAAPAADAAAPAAPANLRAPQHTNVKPTLRWKDVAGVTFRVYRDGRLVARTGAAAFRDGRLGRDGRHTYAVRTVRGRALSRPATAVVVLDRQRPQAVRQPTTLAVSAQPVISWPAAADVGPAGLRGYRVLRDGRPVAVVAGRTFTEDAELAPGTYRYTVRAVDRAGNLARAVSPATLVTVGGVGGAVSQPIGLTAPSPTATAPTLSWSAPLSVGAGALTYTVIRDGVELGTTSATTYTDASSPGAGTRLYSVFATDAAGATSALANVEVEVRPNGPEPEPTPEPTPEPEPTPDPVPTPAPKPTPEPTPGPRFGIFPSTLNGIHLSSAIEVFPGGRIPNAETAAKIARTYDLINILPNQIKGYEDVLKRTNPNLVVHVYQNGMFAQSGQANMFPVSWYMKDRAGNKIRSRGWGNYLMDPRSTAAHTAGGVTYNGWTDWVRKRCKALMDKLPILDGCFLDMLGTAPLAGSYNANGATPSNGGKPFTSQQWIAMTASVGRAVESYTGGPVQGNGMGNGSRYYEEPTKPLFDNMASSMAEIWLRTPVQSATAYPNLEKWRKDVQSLIDTDGDDAVVVTVKTWAGGTAAQKEAWRKFALASYLLGNNGRDYFEFTSDRAKMPWNDLSPLYDLPIGSPTENAASVDGFLRNGVYQRNFTGGRVLVNPGERPVTVALGGTFRTPSGSAVSSITLGAHDAEILTR